MLVDGISLKEGSSLKNLTVESGTAFPTVASEGELFYRTDGANEALYVYDGANWISMRTANSIAGGVAGAIPYQSGVSATAFTAAGSTGQVLVSNGTSAPSWTTSPSLAGTNFTSIPNSALSNSSVTIGGTPISLGATVTTISGLSSVISTTFTGTLVGNSSGLSSGAKGYIPFQNNPGSTTFLPTGTAGQALLTNGAGQDPSWGNPTVGGLTSVVSYTPGTFGSLVLKPSTTNASGIFIATGSGTNKYSGIYAVSDAALSNGPYIGMITGNGGAGVLPTWVGIQAQAHTSGSAGPTNSVPLTLQVGSYHAVHIDTSGNTIFGPATAALTHAALATNATNGFPYIPSMAGAPSGTPTAYTGRAPLVINTSNNQLYWYSGAAWQSTNLVPSAATATNIAGGSTGSVPYQSAAGATAHLSPGASGQVLTSAGAGAAPYWSTVSGGGGGGTGGSKNAIINGCFRIKQRFGTGTITLSAGAYGHDRWKAGASGCTYTYATSGGITTLTITAGSLIQVVEGANLSSDTYVLSWSGTSQGKIGAGSFSSSGVTSSVTGGSDLSIEFGTGTLSRVQLEVGSTATAFERRDQTAELLLCYRYCYRLTVEAGAGLFMSAASFTGATSGLVADRFPVPMRIIPTFVMEGAASDYQVYSSSTASYGAVTALTGNGVTTRNFYLFNFTVGTSVASAGVSGYLASKTATGYSVRFDAEI